MYPGIGLLGEGAEGRERATWSLVGAPSGTRVLEEDKGLLSFWLGHPMGLILQHGEYPDVGRT